MPTWLTGAEAIRYLKVSESTFYRLVREGKITKHVLPGLADPRYRQDELDSLFMAVPVLVPGYSTRIGDSHALVFTPEGEKPVWSLSSVPRTGNVISMGSWVPGFRYESDAGSPPEEQLAAAKSAARQFLQLETVEE